MKSSPDAIKDAEMCRKVHSLNPDHENIQDADDIATVRNQFYEAINSNIGRQQVEYSHDNNLQI